MNKSEKRLKSTSGSAPIDPLAKVQEFTIRVAKANKIKHHLMRFHASLKVDFTEWKTAKMERENNSKQFKAAQEEMPKFGAGSEYNRDLKEEARRKKFGMIAKKYKPEAQPWLLNVKKNAKKDEKKSDNDRKFKGSREGGVGENCAFYVFKQSPDGTIEAFPLEEWYNFQPVQRYKALSAEEAEEEFGRRKKVLNYFSLMMRKRLKGDEEEEVDPEEAKIKLPGKKSKELKISDLDEYMDMSDDSDSDDEEKEKKDDDDDDNKKKKNKGKTAGKEKKKKRDLDDEAFEESDDGDEEGKEMDYDSSSSEDEPDPESKVNKELKSVAEEDALRSSDEEDEDEEKKKKEEEAEKKNNEKEKKKSKKGTKDTSSSGFSSDDIESSPAKKKKNDKRKMDSSLPADLADTVESTPKKSKLEVSPAPSTSYSSGSLDDHGITEQAVRRYLTRKPMTAAELLTKFKSKKSNCSSEQLVETMTMILKKINPTKQVIKGKMYMSLKA